MATEYGLSNLRVRYDNAIVATTESHGYRKVASFINVASEFVGAYV